MRTYTHARAALGGKLPLTNEDLQHTLPARNVLIWRGVRGGQTLNVCKRGWPVCPDGICKSEMCTYNVFFMRNFQQDVYPLRATSEGKTRGGLHMGELSLFLLCSAESLCYRALQVLFFVISVKKFHLDSVLCKSLSCRNVPAISPLSFQNNQNKIESCSCLL